VGGPPAPRRRVDERAGGPGGRPLRPSTRLPHCCGRRPLVAGAAATEAAAAAAAADAAALGAAVAAAQCQATYGTWHGARRRLAGAGPRGPHTICCNVRRRLVQGSLGRARIVRTWYPLKRKTDARYTGQRALSLDLRLSQFSFNISIVAQCDSQMSLSSALRHKDNQIKARTKHVSSRAQPLHLQQSKSQRTYLHIR